jgi:hypothetical protein
VTFIKFAVEEMPTLIVEESTISPDAENCNVLLELVIIYPTTNEYIFKLFVITKLLLFIVETATFLES